MNNEPKAAAAGQPATADAEALLRYFRGDSFARHLGIELLTVEPGRATAKMPLTATHWNALGSVQGGAIFTLADYAFAAASNSHGNVAVGINVSISYLKAAKNGTLWAEAQEVAKNFKLGTYQVSVRDDAGDLVAVFQGMVYRKKDPVPPAAPGA
jgi:acyl-CoA thioesterase